MKLIGALATFALVMGFAVIAALAIGWVMSMWGNFRSFFISPPPLAIDPVAGHVDALKHSHDRAQALAHAHDNCVSGHAGGADCGGGD